MSSALFAKQERPRAIDLIGIENAILDLLLRVDDRVIRDLGLAKGTMKLVDTDEQRVILDRVGELEPEITPGGSCSNVLRAASLLGVRSCYSSAVGDDVFGEAFERGLVDYRVKDQCVRLPGPTGTSVILVTPDGERTMNTHLGVCRRYAREHVPVADIEASRIFFTTGYIWDTPNQIEAIERALAVAREHGCALALDLADPFAVNRSAHHIQEHIERGLAVVFANPEEARMMTGKAPRDAALQLGETIEVAVVKDGPNGAWIVSGGQILHCPTRPVRVVDTTGAGDCFAAGFLYGLLRGLPLQLCGAIANLMAADAISRVGVKLSPDIAERVEALC